VDILLSTIRDCCSKVPGFINPKSPLLESVFRLFLANRNQPLTLQEICDQLKRERGERLTLDAGKLHRLLEKDQYYGLRPTSSPEAGIYS